jgi:hypothetical protein
MLQVLRGKPHVFSLLEYLLLTGNGLWANWGCDWHGALNRNYFQDLAVLMLGRKCLPFEDVKPCKKGRRFTIGLPMFVVDLMFPRFFGCSTFEDAKNREDYWELDKFIVVDLFDIAGFGRRCIMELEWLLEEAGSAGWY